MRKKRNVEHKRGRRRRDEEKKSEKEEENNKGGRRKEKPRSLKDAVQGNNSNNKKPLTEAGPAPLDCPEDSLHSGVIRNFLHQCSRDWGCRMDGWMDGWMDEWREGQRRYTVEGG